MLRKRKNIAVLVIVVLAVCVALWAVLPGEPDGKTPESREQILRELPKGIDWNLAAAAQHVLGNWECIVHPVYASNYDGIAVFEREDGDRYKLQTITYRPKGDIVMCHTLPIDGRSYLFCWLNQDDLDYADVTFTVDGEAPETQRLDTGSNGLELICVETPDAASFTANVVYYDTAGNAIE